MARLKLEVNRLSDPVVNKDCTNFEVNNRTLSLFILNTLIPIVGVSPFPLNELMLLTATLCRIKPKYVFEWGTNIGTSARIFYEISKKFNLGVEIHSIDLPDNIYHTEHPGKLRGHLVKGYKNVTLHTGDGLETAIELSNSFEENASVLFFLDGDHEYSSVIRELSGIVDNFQSPNILIHDTFYQSPEAGYNVGPYQAVKDFFNSTSIPYDIISTNIGLPGMTLLYIK